MQCKYLGVKLKLLFVGLSQELHRLCNEIVQNCGTLNFQNVLNKTLM